jgi:hypothetical protein
MVGICVRGFLEVSVCAITSVSQKTKILKNTCETCHTEQNMAEESGSIPFGIAESRGSNRRDPPAKYITVSQKR